MEILCFFRRAFPFCSCALLSFIYKNKTDSLRSFTVIIISLHLVGNLWNVFKLLLEFFLSNHCVQLWLMVAKGIEGYCKRLLPLLYLGQQGWAKSCPSLELVTSGGRWLLSWFEKHLIWCGRKEEPMKMLSVACVCMLCFMFEVIKVSVRGRKN